MEDEESNVSCCVYPNRFCLRCHTTAVRLRVPMGRALRATRPTWTVRTSRCAPTSMATTSARGSRLGAAQQPRRSLFCAACFGIKTEKNLGRQADCRPTHEKVVCFWHHLEIKIASIWRGEKVVSVVHMQDEVYKFKPSPHSN